MTALETRVGTWRIDPAHSVAEFAVKHLVVSTVKGRFHELDGRIHLDEERPEASTVEARIGVASIDTGIGDRDAHLRSDDFFNAERHPYITFRSRRVERVSDDEWRVTGDLTVRDITREVTLATRFEGRSHGTAGEVVAFTAETAISRKEFGLKWNAVLESGTVVVGDRVSVVLHIEAVRE
ncbi:MAG TPA: YceI family protein [Dehalococcoidia bacterium]|nr:YceI family protein [Dehalococcoidia bacterium]